MRHRTVLAALLLAVAAMPAVAQLVPKSITAGLAAADVSAITAVTIALADGSDPIGTIKPWSNPDGKNGHVKLLERGPGKARVRVSETRADGERLIYRVAISKDAEGRWRIG